MVYFFPSIRSGIRFIGLLLSVVFTLPLATVAQTIGEPLFQCATENLSPALRQALETEAALALQKKRASGATFTSITYVPLRPHIIRTAAGTGGYSLTSLNNVLALTNKYYLLNGNGIQFYFAGTTPDYINNDALFAQFRKKIDETTIKPNDVNNALNQYYVNAFDQTGLGGYAVFPFDSVGSTRTIILNENNDVDMGNRLVPHELGHTFNLLHTHEPFYGNELVTRGAGANCTTAGDLVCDTPADPYGHFAGADYTCLSGCPPTYVCSFTDTQGNTYTPLPTNIMSYYFPCVHDFTPGQYDRVQAGLATRQAHTTYTLNAPPTVMTAPSNVSAVASGTRVVITWQDNSSNEMGYFIERSTLAASGFVAIGGVAPNITTFDDRSGVPFTRYYYRVKPSNTTTGSISTTATAVAPSCIPVFSNNGCPFSINITGVTVNSTTLSQNSGCSASDYYTSFTAVSGTVTAGQSATFTITKGASYPTGGAVWVDVNNNGAFETGERLYQMPATNTSATFSGSLAIPLSTTAPSVAMRVVVAYNTLPGDACGNYGYGETEDYRLVVIQPCLTAMASLNTTSATITAGQTTTLTASLTGTAPWSLTVNASGLSPVVFNSIATSPFQFTVSPSISTTYTLGSVTNACGSGTVSGTAVVTVNACMVMSTVKAGNWNDPTVWSCNRVPLATDPVQVGHVVTIPASLVARALRVRYVVGGKLSLVSTARLRLGP